MQNMLKDNGERMKRTRSFIDTLFFTSFYLDRGKGCLLIVSLCSIIMGFIRVLSAGNLNKFLFYAGLFLLCYSVFRFVKDLIATKGLEINRDQSLSNIIEDIKPSGIEEENGYRKIANRYHLTETYVYSKQVNSRIRDDANIEIVEDVSVSGRLKDYLVSRKEVFVPIIRRMWWKALLQNKVFINEKKIGLFSEPLLSNDSLFIYKTDYFSTFLTNELSTSIASLISSRRPLRYYDGTRDFPVSSAEKEYRIRNLGEYVAGNHIGISSIAFTKDRHMCLWVQSGKTFYSERRLAPTGSGSLDWSDYDKQDLISLLDKGMRRELVEECNKRIHKKVLKEENIVKSDIIGFFRNISRAGKPDFVGICLVNVGHLVLEPSWEGQERQDLGIESRYEVRTFAQLVEKINDLLEKKNCLNILSIPLHANLMALKDLIEEEPDKIKSFLEYDQ